jgi:chemotaxis protein CheX
MQKYADSFVEATTSVFSTMLGWEVAAGTPDASNTDCECELRSLIGLSGQTSGVVLVQWDENVAKKAAGAMLGSEPTEINGDVIDTLGEITNMIAGAAKAKLSPLFSNLALPIVLVGKNHGVNVPKNVKPIRIPFQSPNGEFSIEIDIKEPELT